MRYQSSRNPFSASYVSTTSTESVLELSSINMLINIFWDLSFGIYLSYIIIVITLSHVACSCINLLYELRCEQYSFIYFIIIANLYLDLLSVLAVNNFNRMLSQQLVPIGTSKQHCPHQHAKHTNC